MPVERCSQCGTARRGDLQVCVRCETPFPVTTDVGEQIDLALPRPAAPSRTQSHGTLMALLLSGFVVLAGLLYLSVRNIGPFTGRVVSTAPPADGTVQVTVEVTNEGSRPGRARCSITRALPETGDERAAFQFLSEKVPAERSVTQVVEVPVDPGVVVTGEIVC